MCVLINCNQLTHIEYICSKLIFIYYLFIKQYASKYKVEYNSIYIKLINLYGSHLEFNDYQKHHSEQRYTSQRKLADN